MMIVKSLASQFIQLGEIVWGVLCHPVESCRFVKRLPVVLRARATGRAWPSRSSPGEPAAAVAATNPLEVYFRAHQTGRGIWKWNHYFEIYHRHFQKFVGREVHVMEIGIYSGGSLDLWKAYFGPGCRVYGVDIEAACKAYEDERTRIFVGDQADRAFWRRVREQVPTVDILIDDGGHLHEQQIVTLEEMLPHLRPGGVYLCEDVHGAPNRFASCVHGLTCELNAFQPSPDQPTSTPTPFQEAIHSIHSYPFVTVIEKAGARTSCFAAQKQGTEWQPFFDRAAG